MIGMNKLAAALIGVWTLAVVPPIASPMTEAECSSVFRAADINADGVLSDTEGLRYFAAIRVAHKPIPTAPMSQAAFMESFNAGVFTAALIDTGAPLPGANSFTVAQAKDRAMAASLTNVSALTKDDKSVWRGTASDGARGINVAVEFKGNVVAK
jgi:hypothetical protein